mmetsp:Transcript_625/g.632  ORF Transcript_625/g.632 Transcript_625/m.632 type:complete len:247 (-) Transcript_625:495-1235(-)
MVKHNEDTKHPIAFSFADLSFWCYDCDTYVISSKFKRVHDHFYDQKFGEIDKTDTQKIIEKIAELDINKEDAKDGESSTDTESKLDKEEEKKEVPEDSKTAPEGEGEEEKPKFSREELIENLKSGKYKKVTVLTGAGISVSAGIPDFRSPKIGLYATLKEKYDMDDPSEIFSIDKFYSEPELFYDFCKELNWDKYDPTPTHYFIGFLHHKGLLDMNFTQNIDALESKAGIPQEKLVPAHGNMSGAH